MSAQLKTRYDIIINGGGIVGFTLLNLIRQSPYLKNARVLLIEQSNKPPSCDQPPRISQLNDGLDSTQHTIRFSSRVSSITPSSRDILQRLQVWAKLGDLPKETNKIKVWNYDYNHRIVFEQDRSNHDSSEALFTVVENDRLSLALLNRIYELSNGEIPLRWNHSLQSLRQGEGKLIDVVATCEGTELELTAPLVLGCDGFRSKVRELTNMKYREFELGKTAVVGTIAMESNFDSSENDIAYQRFSAEKDSVAALLPLDAKHSSFVISAPRDYAQHLMTIDADTFVSEFNSLLSSDEISPNPLIRNILEASNISFDMLHTLFKSSGLSKPTSDFGGEGFSTPPQVESLVEGSRASFPLVFGSTSPKMITPLEGVVVLGDSSHRVHTLAGQGLNLGIKDCAELVAQLDDVAKCGERIFNDRGSAALNEALKKFELRRQAYILPMIGGILAMPHLFKLTPSRLVSAFNQCDPVKSVLIRFASG